jgi:1-phosphofructokinase
MKSMVTVTLNPAVDQVIEVDRLMVGAMNRARSSQPMTGGKGINVARVLKGFGLDVVATGFLGGAGAGMAAQTLEQEGVAARFVPVSGEMRVNLKVHDRQGGRTTEINQPGFAVDDAAFARLAEQLRQLLPQAAALVLTGSLPPGCPENAYRQLGILAAEHGVPVFLDADGENLKWGVSAMPYAVKPNEDELRRYSGLSLKNDREWVLAMRGLRRNGVRQVAATMGPEGVMMLDGHTAWHAPGLNVRPACATGAGDAALAAMIWAWHQVLPPQRTVALMSAAGGMTAAKPGIAFCTLEEMIAGADSLRAREIDMPPEEER